MLILVLTVLMDLMKEMMFAVDLEVIIKIVAVTINGHVTMATALLKTFYVMVILH